MLIVDELKKNDPQLRLVAILIAGALVILVIGLWWVQVVCAREYQAHLDTQAYRTIRMPAVRGKILDREGRVLAENRPRYNLSLYLDDLRKQFAEAIRDAGKQALEQQTQDIAAQEKKLGRSLSKSERKQFAFTHEYVEKLHEQARDEVAARLIAQISRSMGETIPFDVARFNRHYATELAMPFPILENLNQTQIARFEENFTNGLGADLELQSMRSYPLGTSAAHLLGELRRDDSSLNGEEPFFNYRLPDYKGVTGIEGAFNDILHGLAGQESVLVNNMGYRQALDVESEPQAGENLVLTLDEDIQHTAEQSILNHQGATVNAAAVVMDVRNGDVLAMASSPVFDPNDFAQAHGIPRQKYEELQAVSAEKNRATQENYAPGSIFKVIIGLAALEDGLNPDKIYTVDSDPRRPGMGYIKIGRRPIDDLAPAGDYNFKRALEHSSNSYFIQIGLQTGVDRIVELAGKFHFGQKCHLPTRQESPGIMPDLKQVHHDWSAGDTANVCIGQGAVAVTPLQMAIAFSAVANGGTVFWPRLVSRTEPQDPSLGGLATNLPAGLVRDHLGVSARSLNILHDAMLGETEEGTGKAVQVPGLRICGKTGTAQVQDSSNRTIGHNYWFASYAPYENPKYAVVVMVQSDTEVGFGGTLCAPIAHDIYEEIVKKENPGTARMVAAVTTRSRN